MATVGQTTASGGRSLPTHPQGGPMRRVTVPVAFVVNHIGGWFWEQVAAGDNNLKAALYSTAGILLAESNIVTTPLTSTSTPELVQMSFSGQSFPAGDYDLVVSAGGGVSGYVLTNGQNGTAGTPVAFFFEDDATNYPDFEGDISANRDTAAARAWDLYLDYSEASTGRPALLSQLQTNGEAFL